MSFQLEDAYYCADVIEKYYKGYSRIDQYMFDEKMEYMRNNYVNTLFPIEDELFSDFTMHPNDMDIEVCEIESQKWSRMLNITSSFIHNSSPGRNVRLAVRERNTNKYLGFIKIGSPVINCKPRNEILGQVFTQSPEWSKSFNKTSMMGFVIVPSQPFGFNYLGGKLIASVCCSHEVREMINKKYNMNLCFFETTSLYGSSKTTSQYDGMKPYLRHKCDTLSNFLPIINGKTYRELLEHVESKIGKFISDDDSSKKLKRMNMIITLTKNQLKKTDRYDNFVRVLEHAKNLTERKRYYISNYGFSNYIDVVKGRTDTLVKDENYDKHHLENIIKWWKNKATNRYETLKTENRLRTELEVWTSGKQIDIIR